jgi:hypothetical protein
MHLKHSGNVRYAACSRCASASRWLFGSLPGALIWLLYPFPPARHNAERGG